MDRRTPTGSPCSLLPASSDSLVCCFLLSLTIYGPSPMPWTGGRARGACTSIRKVWNNFAPRSQFTGAFSGPHSPMGKQQRRCLYIRIYIYIYIRIYIYKDVRVDTGRTLLLLFYSSCFLFPVIFLSAASQPTDGSASSHPHWLFDGGNALM